LDGLKKTENRLKKFDTCLLIGSKRQELEQAQEGRQGAVQQGQRDEHGD
jgi:hypothetical protein